MANGYNSISRGVLSSLDLLVICLTTQAGTKKSI